MEPTYQSLSPLGPGGSRPSPPGPSAAQMGTVPFTDPAMSLVRTANVHVAAKIVVCGDILAWNIARSTIAVACACVQLLCRPLCLAIYAQQPAVENCHTYDNTTLSKHTQLVVRFSSISLAKQCGV